MQFVTSLRIIGILLMFFSLTMLIPIIIDFIYHEDTWAPFFDTFCLTLATGFLLWYPLRTQKKDLKIRDGFIITVLFWTVLSLFGALPFIISYHPNLSLTDAVFEAVSGLTTTGASVMQGIEFLPHSVLFYRQQLQFFGGMGIIVLAVAILPMLGIGGMQLYRTEIPGPAKDKKLTPRIAESAKFLWLIYVGLVILCALGYWASGMPLFNAIGESFGTVSTGGFSMHDASFAYYHSPLIELIGILFMILGAVNFSLHFVAIQRRNLSLYWQDQEFRAYIKFLLFLVVLVAATLIYCRIYIEPEKAILKSAFNVVSMATTTGLVSAPFASWPLFLPFVIMISAYIGGCAFSTAGGLKMIRASIVFRQFLNEIKRLVHPRAIMPIKLNKHILPDDVVYAIWSFFSAVVLCAVFGITLLMANGMDLETAFSAYGACFANAGAGIGDVADNFSGVQVFNKWVLIFIMIAGRLEIFTLLVLFTPAFWHK